MVANEEDSAVDGVAIRTVVAGEEDSSNTADISSMVVTSNNSNRVATTKEEVGAVTAREVSRAEVTSKAAVEAVEAVCKGAGHNLKKTTTKATAVLIAVAGTVPEQVEDTRAVTSTATVLEGQATAVGAAVADQDMEETSNIIGVALVGAVDTTTIEIVATIMTTIVVAAEVVVAEVAVVAGPTTTAVGVAKQEIKHDERHFFQLSNSIEISFFSLKNTNYCTGTFYCRKVCS